jgi:hypothetical protein
MLGRMDSTMLKPWQARVIYQALHPLLGYLHRLRKRMERRGFPPDDKLLKLTEKACDAIHALAIELHYRSCQGGVGRGSVR